MALKIRISRKGTGVPIYHPIIRRRATKFMAERIVYYADAYTPYKTGKMKSQISYKQNTLGDVKIQYDARSIRGYDYPTRQWNTQFVHYSHNELGLRGSRWIERMLIDKGELIRKQVEDYYYEELSKR